MKHITCYYCNKSTDKFVYAIIFKNFIRKKLAFCSQDCADMAQMSAEG